MPRALRRRAWDLRGEIHPGRLQPSFPEPRASILFPLLCPPGLGDDRKNQSPPPQLGFGP